MKVNKLENFVNKISLTVSKWSSLKAQSTETPCWHLLLTYCPFSFSERRLAPRPAAMLSPRPIVSFGNERVREIFIDLA